MRLGIVVAGAAVVTIVAIACAQPKLPHPPYTRHPTSALVAVPYPPPPARAESIPRQPRDGAAWIDGEWMWQVRRWSWKPGRWLTPPPNARFAPWTTVRDRAGTLYMASGAWRDANGVEVTEPPALATGVPGAGAIVSPEGEKVEQGPITPTEAGRRANGGADLDAAAERATIELDALPLPEQDGGRMLDASSNMEKP